MQLSDEIINAFVKTLPNGEKDNSNGYELYYGTVKVSDGKTSVILDGSSVETPLNYLTMGAENGDRVTCIIKDHSLIVTGNLTHPSEGMTTKYIETMTVLAQEAAIGKLIATEGDFTELTADSAFVKRLMSDQVGASILTADEAFVGSLQSQIVTADKIKALQAEIGYVDAETLEADYLQADMANLKIVEATKAAIVNLLADMAFVKNATISQGHITGALDSVTLNANYITAGSLSVDRLYINGPDGKPRLVEFNADGEPVATTIDASILTDRTITADKLVANSITANEISTDFIAAFKANIMQTVTEDLHAVTAEIEKLISGDTELDTLKLKEPLAEEYGGTGETSFATKLIHDMLSKFGIQTSSLNNKPAIRIKSSLLVEGGIQTIYSQDVKPSYISTDEIHANSGGICGFKFVTEGAAGSTYYVINGPDEGTIISVKSDGSNATFEGRATGNLPLTGGTVNGDITLNSGARNTPSIAWHGTKRHINSGIYNNVDDWYIWDETRSQAILRSPNDSFLFTDKTMGFNNGLTARSGWMDWYISSQNRGSIFCNVSNDNSFYVRANLGNMYLGSNKMTTAIYSQGSIYMKTEAYLEVANNAWNTWMAVKASDFLKQSSKLTKENISDMSNEDGNKILKLRPIHFDYKEKFGGQKGRSGLIAEEVIEIIPESVSVPEGYNEDDFDESKGLANKVLSIDYTAYVPYLIKLCQTQQKQIDALSEELTELRKIVDNIS